MTEKIDINSVTMEELKEILVGWGEKPFRAGQIFGWLHEKRVTSFEEMTNLSKALREKMEEECVLTKIEEIDRLESVDGTKKFLFELHDGQAIESVLMKYHHGNSVCISSQAGCRMGCKFCASTLGGLIRNLSAGEMLQQIYEIERITGDNVSNVVVMGTGEPMDNYDNFIRFVRILSAKEGKNISVRNITVSTCGIVENIKCLAEEKLPLTLALSLHAPNDEIRKQLMPVAYKYKLEDVLAACDFYYEKTGRRITYEYSLVEGVNDSAACASELAARLKGKNCHVNLIPVNSIKERDFKKSGNAAIQNFKNTLEKKSIACTIRREMGSDINAACGQLRRSHTLKESAEGEEE